MHTSATSSSSSRTSRILCKLLFAMKTIVVSRCMCIGMHIAKPCLLRVSLCPVGSHSWIHMMLHIHTNYSWISLYSCLPPALWIAAPASVRPAVSCRNFRFCVRICNTWAFNKISANSCQRSSAAACSTAFCIHLERNLLSASALRAALCHMWCYEILQCILESPAKAPLNFGNMATL